jgi:hypothetical protein
LSTIVTLSTIAIHFEGIFGNRLERARKRRKSVPGMFFRSICSLTADRHALVKRFQQQQLVWLQSATWPLAHHLAEGLLYLPRR